jgi:hypothetical protein
MDNLSTTIEPFLFLRSTIRNLFHDLTHHPVTPYQYNHAMSSDVATPRATSSSYHITSPNVYTFVEHNFFPTTPESRSLFLRTFVQHSNCNSIPILGSRSSENILQWSWLLWVLLMVLSLMGVRISLCQGL